MRFHAIETSRASLFRVVHVQSCRADVVQGQGRPLLRPPLLCPEIHGESGLEFAEGGSMQDYAMGSPVPGKAVNVMFERISAQYKKR